MPGLKSKRLEIDALRVLQAIHQHGGITRAAEALGLTQSAVSHKVKRLEVNLDCPLLTRRSGGPMFTSSGQDLLKYAERILGLHDEAVLNLVRTTLSGRILLGLTEDTAMTELSQILARFPRLPPDVIVRSQVRMSLTLRDLLDRKELDAAIMQIFDHEVRPTDVVLFHETLHWVKSRDISLGEQGAIPFLSFDDACFYRHWAMDIGQDGGMSLDTVFECSSAAGIANAVQAGLGVALLSERHITPEMEILHDRLPAPPALSYVVRRSRRERNPALDELVTQIEFEIGRKGGLSLAG
jgi:molybdate transport repressor ModE-like protein